MSDQQRSEKNSTAQGARIVSGIAKAVQGIAKQDYISIAVGAVEALPVKKILIVLIGIILFIVLLPVIILASLPQMLFSWSFSNDAEIIVRNQYANELTAHYYEVLAEQHEGVSPDVNWLICIQCVLANQDVDNITMQDIDDMVALSYTVDSENGEIYNKTADEIMDELGLSENQRNWARLMYGTINIYENSSER